MDFNKQNILGMIARNQVNPRGAIAYQDQMKQQEAQQRAMEAQRLQQAQQATQGQQLLNRQRQQALQQAGRVTSTRLQGRDGNMYEVDIDPNTKRVIGQPRRLDLGQPGTNYITKPGGDGKTYQIPVDANGRQIGKAIPIDGLPGRPESGSSGLTGIDLGRGQAVNASGAVVGLPGATPDPTFEEKEAIKARQQRASELGANAGSRVNSLNTAKEYLRKFEEGEVSSGLSEVVSDWIVPGKWTEQGEFNEQFDSFAERAARAMLQANGEVRPTDADVEGAKKALFGVGKDENTNIKLLKAFIAEQQALEDQYQQLKQGNGNPSPVVPPEPPSDVRVYDSNGNRIR